MEAGELPTPGFIQEIQYNIRVPYPVASREPSAASQTNKQPPLRHRQVPGHYTTLGGIRNLLE